MSEQSPETRLDQVVPLAPPAEAVHRALVHAPMPVALDHRGGPVAVAGNQAMVPDTATLLRAVKRHWFLIAVLGALVGSGAAAAIYLSVPAKYVATAVLRVQSSPPHLVYPAKEGNYRTSFEMFMRTQEQSLRMPLFQSKALDIGLDGSLQAKDGQPFRFKRVTRDQIKQNDKAGTDPVAWLDRQVRVSASARSEFMRISAENENAQVAADLVNAVVYAYLDEIRDSEDKETSNRREQLDRIAVEHRKLLKGHYETLQRLASKTGGTSDDALNAKQVLLVEDAGLLRKEWLRVGLEILRTKVSLQLAEARLEAAPGSVPSSGAADAGQTDPVEAETEASESRPDEGVTNTEESNGDVFIASDGSSEAEPAQLDGVRTFLGPNAEETEQALIRNYVERDVLVKSYLQQIQAMEIKLQEASAKASRKDEPSLVRMRSKLEDMRKRLAERRAELEPQAVEEIRKALETQRAFEVAQQFNQLQEQVRQLELQLRGLEEQEKELKRRYEAIEPETAEAGKDAFALEMVRKDIAREEEIVRRVEGLLQNMDVEKRAPARIELIEPATAPKQTDNGRRIKLAGFGAMGGFGVVAFLIGFIEVRRQRIMVPEDVAHRVGVAVVGTVPELPLQVRRVGSRGGSMAAGTEPWHRVFQESIDSLRAQLMFSNPSQPLRSVMVTSAVAGEGKTVLATHLSVSLARAGQRTLLVDADLRRPSLHELFDMAPAPGLSEIVTRQATKEAAIVQSPFVGLDVLVAGDRLSDPAKLLSDTRFGELIEQLRREYRFLILDLPPVLPFSDALLVGQHVDGALFSVLRDVSQTHHLRSASERLRAVGIGILGAVLGGVVYEDYMYQHYRSADEANHHNE